MMTRGGLSIVLAALLLQAPATRAAQLDKDTCTKLKTEQGQLELSGTRGNLDRGPEWAKASLPPEKLEQVRRLIEVDEQLLFRCGGRPLVTLPNDPDPAAREGESKDGAKGPAGKGTKAPAPEKKKSVPLKKAAAPPANPPPQHATAALVKDAAKATLPGNAPPQAGATSAVPEAASKETEEKKAAALKAAKARAKKKAEEANRAASQDWFSNPFGSQAAPAKK